MRITFNVSGSVDVSAKEIIELIQESERLDAQRYEKHNAPVPSNPLAQPVEKVVDVNKESWLGKRVKMNSILSSEDITELGYDDFKGGEVTEQTPLRIKIKENEISHYWHYMHLFELVKEETK